MTDRDISSEQLEIVGEFVKHYKELAAGQVGGFDQASAWLRDTLSKLGIDFSPEEPRDFYLVMTGLSIGTNWKKGIIETQGHTEQDAGEMMRAALALLCPGPPQP